MPRETKITTVITAQSLNTSGYDLPLRKGVLESTPEGAVHAGASLLSDLCGDRLTHWTPRLSGARACVRWDSLPLCTALILCPIFVFSSPIISLYKNEFWSL